MAALDAGADDVADDGGTWRVTCDPSRTSTTCKAALEAAGFEVESAESHDGVASIVVPVTDVDDARKVLRIVDALEDNDDVQDVYCNFDIDDERDGSGQPDERRGRRPGARRSRCPAPAGATYSLADFAGQPVVLVFYPGRRHAGVHQAAERLQRRPRPVRGLDAQVLGISAQERRQPREVLAASTASSSRCSPTPTRPSPALYGTLGPLGFPRRSVFIIDGDGVIRYAHRAIAGLTYRPVERAGRAELDRQPPPSAAQMRRASTQQSRDHGGATGRLSYEPVFVPARADGTVRVLGIDPGLTRCGYAVLDGRGPGARRRRVAGRDPHPARPIRCRSGWPRCGPSWSALIAEFEPDAVAVEQVFFQVNVRTAMSVGQASGLALAEAAAAGCEVVQYTPNQVKDAVAGWGGGRQGAGAEDGAGAPRPRRAAAAGRRRRRRGAGAVPPRVGADATQRVAAAVAAAAGAGDDRLAARRGARARRSTARC